MIFFIFCKCKSISVYPFRLPVTTFAPHRRTQATCYLIIPVRVTLKTSPVEKHKNICVWWRTTKADHIRASQTHHDHYKTRGTQQRGKKNTNSVYFHMETWETFPLNVKEILPQTPGSLVTRISSAGLSRNVTWTSNQPLAAGPWCLCVHSDCSKLFSDQWLT